MSPAMPVFQCQSCRKDFEVPQVALDKYPGWKPKICITCREAETGKKRASPGAERSPRTPSGAAARSARPAGAGSARARGAGSKGGLGSAAQKAQGAELNLTVKQVLDRFTEGPQDGVFTDGAASPNPGPGGWGAVYVKNGEIIAEAHGHEGHTTNNRMELTALIAGFELVPDSDSAEVWSDSQLCVNTINTWAAQWEKKGWKRNSGEIKNLDLVQRLYALSRSKPKLKLQWIRAHSGLRWNEYADALATAYRRPEK